MQPTVIYYDILEGTVYDETGSQYGGNRNISTYLDNHTSLEIHYVIISDDTDTTNPTSWTKWTGLQNTVVASSVAIDDNMLHAVRGTLAEAVTTSSTTASVTASSGQIVNPTGSITFIGSDGSKQSVEYTSWTYADGKYTFTITNTLLSGYDVGSTVRIPEALIMKSEGSDVDDTQASQGIFTINLYALSYKLLDKLDYSSTDSITATFQHKIISEGEVLQTFSFPFVINNLLDYGNESVVPNQETSTQASKAWILSLLRTAPLWQFAVTNSETDADWHDVQTTSDRFVRYRWDASSAWSTGIQLIAGKAATINVGTTTTGDAGTSASVTNTGTSSAAVLNFTIPKGDAGKAATINVGTTTTGDAGTSASVTNTGTSSAAVLNFTIPKGDTGASTSVTVGSTVTAEAGELASVTNGGTSDNVVLNFSIPKGMDATIINQKVEVTSATENIISVPAVAMPVSLVTNLGNIYPIEKESITYNSVNSNYDISIMPYLAYDNVSSFTGSWFIYYAGGEASLGIVANPAVEFTVLDTTFGRCCYLDTTTPIMSFFDPIWNAKAIKLRLVSSLSTATGNVVLIPVINGVDATAVTVAVTGTASEIRMPLDNVTGTIAIKRDTESTNDTLKDETNVAITCCVLNTEIYVKNAR